MPWCEATGKVKRNTIPKREVGLKLTGPASFKLNYRSNASARYTMKRGLHVIFVPF
jgi:hypothetical protein